MIEKDKLIHFCISLLLSQLAYLCVWFILVPIGVGITKELYDKYVRKTKFNWRDWIVTVAGIIPVMVILILR